MKVLAQPNKPDSPTAACAQALLETIPHVMCFLRRETRACPSQNLSLPEFRVLYFVSHNAGASLSAVAEFVGIALPSMSKQVEHLVERKLVRRDIHPEDRRKVVLHLTSPGRQLLDLVHVHVRRGVADLFAKLNADERATLLEAMRLLDETFGASGGKSCVSLKTA